MALNINQYALKMRNSELNRGELMKLAGHFQRHPELILHPLVLWEPTHEHKSRGRPRLTFVDSLRFNTLLKETKEIAVTMADRDRWRALVHDSREYYPPLTITVTCNSIQ